MTWKISMILSVLFFVGCNPEKTVNSTTLESEFLINEKDLVSMVGQEAVKILDFRKKGEYELQHIPGAIHIWRNDIEDESYTYTGMMASKSQMETLFGKLGIHSDDMVIIYDDNGMCDASKLWWILQSYNFDNVKMLEGGFSAWKAIEGETTKEIPVVTKSEFKLPGIPNMKNHISRDEFLKEFDNNITILDTRTTDEFSGKRQKKGAAKGGRIPKSQHIDWAEAINYDGDKKLKTPQELEGIYGQLTKDKNDPIIVYCHSGVRSAHTTFVLTELLGYENVRNYDGSWTEWSQFDDLPYELDIKTTIK